MLLLTSHDVRKRALNYLQTHQVLSLATHGPLGLWAAAVFYASDGFDCYFLSAAHTRHARNIAINPNVAATIQEDYRDWEGIQGIQLEGPQVPFRQDGERTEPQLQAALSKVNWYRIRPSTFYFIDNSRGLGHRDKITLSG